MTTIRSVKPKPKRRARAVEPANVGTITRAMVMAAKPAAFTGCRFDLAAGKADMVCWPGCRFPGQRHVTVLERQQCGSTSDAIALATIILVRRRREWAK